MHVHDLGLLAHITGRLRINISLGYFYGRYQPMSHALETKWGVPAETILDAIAGAGDLTQRGVRGVLAEHQFRNVLDKLPPPWTIAADKSHSTDFALTDGHGGMLVTIQVKMQALSAGVPKLDDTGWAMVETQKSRYRGTGHARTRLYAYDDFDILAVSLWPSTKDWGKFMFAYNHALAPSRRRGQMAGWQSVPPKPNDLWTDDLAMLVSRVAGKHSIRETEIELALD